MPIDNIDFDTMMATKDAARSAFGAAAAAWLFGWSGLALNAAGLLFIWRQLRTTESAARSAQAAVDVALLAERPWMKLHVAEAMRIEKRGGSYIIQVQFSAENVGNTPAIAVRGHYHANQFMEMERIEQWRPIIYNFPTFGDTLFCGERYTYNFSWDMGPLPKDVIPCWTALIGVTYCIPGTTIVRHTVEDYFLQIEDQSINKEIMDASDGQWMAYLAKTSTRNGSPV